MIPLRDDNPRRTFPIVNYVLIAANILGFLWELRLGNSLDRAIMQVGFIPARFWITGYWTADLFSIVISMFLHGGFLHIGSNMLYLWIFGDNVEDRLGHFRYLLFYFLCGFGATYAHAIFSPSSRLPAIGASGAIAGVLGAYFFLFPLSRVIVLVPILFFPFFFELPAATYLAIWALGQVFSGTLSLAEARDVGGIAWWAHVGGFIAGIVLHFFFIRRGRAYRRPVRDEYAIEGAWLPRHYWRK